MGEDVRRFEERLLTLQARTRALETVALGPVAGSLMAPASVERELTIVTVSPRIDEQVQRLRGELGLPAGAATPVARLDDGHVERPQLEAAS